MVSGTLRLCSRKTFLPILLTQFFGAFNDNAYKLSMLTLISFFLSTGQSQSEKYQAIASALFIVPFFLFSAVSGQLADKYDKAKMIRFIKIFEVFLMIIGGFGLYYGNIWIMMCILACLGIHSTFFGPIKYAILPDHLSRNQLLSATALIEGSTFLAILLGTTLGAISIVGSGKGVIYAIILTLFAAISGLVSSFFIPPARSKLDTLKVDWRFLRASVAMIRQATSNSKLVPVFLALSWFWFVATVVLIKLPDYTNYVLRGDTSVFALFLAMFSIGIAVGSMAINWFLQGEYSLRYVPHALVLLSLFVGELYWMTPDYAISVAKQPLFAFFNNFSNVCIAIDFFMVSFSGGLCVVPLYTYLQVMSADGFRARTIAVNNIFNAIFMVVGTVVVMVLLSFRASIPQVFLIVAFLNAVAAFFCWRYFKLGSESLASV